MVTGDFQLTTSAIARACGVVTQTALSADGCCSFKTLAPSQSDSDKPYAPNSIVPTGPEVVEPDEILWPNTMKSSSLRLHRSRSYGLSSSSRRVTRRLLVRYCFNNRQDHSLLYNDE